MQHLTGLDEMFLGMDTMTTHGNVAGICVFDGGKNDQAGRGGVKDGDRVAWLRQRVAERLPRLQALRWRLTPIGPDHYWTEVPVDLDYHVRGITLEAPGTERQLLDRISAIMSVHLDRSKPMWRLYVIEGLEGGKYAYFFKVNHGLADGSAMWMILDQLADSPVEKIEPTPIHVDGPVEMMTGAAQRMATMPTKMASVMGAASKWLMTEVGEKNVQAVPSILSALMAQRPSLMPPKTPFNGTTTPNLGLALVDLPLADLRRAGKAAGGTINDAILAVTAGALRAYMKTHGGVPAEPIVSTSQVSWRTGEESERWANQIWMMFLHLPTHIADPVERLHAAHESATKAKKAWEALPGYLIRDMSALMPGLMISPMMQMMAMMPAEMMPAMYNVSVSNVRGPSVRPHYDGNELERYFIHGFLSPTTGLLIGGQSLGDRMVLSMTACKDLVRDYQQLPKLMEDALEELLAAEHLAPMTH
ncbi:MAG TPA: wax ester/triacylglycerol synthase family O-acyltransferase [Dermatophilaceae bacterium]|nr:wax ester/triacylglycerol synthase family O-acyltransferase [Dermatophilaceae bacterium]